MKQKLLLAIATLALLILTVGPGLARERRDNPSGTGERHSFLHQGKQRAYRIHVPSGYDGKSPVPLLFCFHGGGGTAEISSRMGFTPLSEKEGFIVVYPEGLNKHWNDGRKSAKFAAQDAETDDVSFVLALLDSLQKHYRIDPSRVFTTGASNGGFFSQRLAIEASEVFAAAGIMIATLPKPFEENFHPARPVSILYMNGTDDPFVPYGGGPITPEFFPLLRKLNPDKDYQRGHCSSTDKSLELWRAANGTGAEPVVKPLPDKDPDDGCNVETITWSGGREGTSVVLYKIMGGGHTIPGGASYLPERIIGKTCRDFDGVGTIWEFLKNHARSASP
ncbi:MAG: PHB depolymerase family esterase [Verrucomicrobiales bacterium]